MKTTSLLSNVKGLNLGLNYNIVIISFNNEGVFFGIENNYEERILNINVNVITTDDEEVKVSYEVITTDEYGGEVEVSYFENFSNIETLLKLYLWGL